ncbi:MAG: YHS domain-containing protein [Acidobacteria bacterium]|nr:YHS domain-containing protein [Acidobacteriota bacterium]
METQKDPVRGMQVAEETAAGQSEYKGKTYYFCNPGCKSKFDESPERYTGGSETQSDSA